MERTWEVLYHYTSLDSFVNIIKSKKFRLYDVTKSNDPLEGSYMIHALEKAYQKLHDKEKINDEEYALARQTFFFFKEELISQGRFNDFCGAASFCVPEHELMMLRSYGNNGKGIALGVPIKALEMLANNNQQLIFKKVEYLSEQEIIDRAAGFWLRKIRFWQEKIPIIDEKTVAPFVRELNEYYYMSYFVKDKVNKDEEEYRLLYLSKDLFEIRLPGLGKTPHQDIDFISVGDDLKAYYEIPVGNSDKDLFYFSDVISGPNCKATDREIQTFLYCHGFQECSVCKNSWVKMR